MISLIGKKTGKSILIPECVEEIKIDNLVSYVNKVNIPPHTAIVAVVYNTTLADIVLMGKRKNTNVSVVPVLVKHTGDNYFANIGDRLIISRGNLERAFQLNVQCGIGLNSVSGHIVGNGLEDSIIKDKDFGNKRICLVDFKIMPLIDITACFDSNNTDSFIDPYIEFNDTVAN